MSKKEKKEEFVDDGRTIYNMNVDGFSWYDKNNKGKDKVYVTKEEKRTLIKAAYRTYLPILLIVLLAFGITIFLIYLWLK